MKDLLERDGYLVHEARDGVQALDQVDKVAPDIIVLDLNLPGLDGYAVLARLRSRPTTQGVGGRIVLHRQGGGGQRGAAGAGLRYAADFASPQAARRAGPGRA